MRARMPATRAANNGRESRELDKAPDAFRTISEVAEEINVPQHVLRFWESRFAQIRPMKRGGGRRYYRPDDVDLLRGVRHLLYGAGYTIRGVQRILREKGIAFVQTVWRAGSELPPPGADEDGAEEGADEDVARQSQERLLRILSPSRLEDRPAKAGGAERREPIMSVGGSGEASPRVSSEERRKLQAVLDELVDCRRLIDAALADNHADDNSGRGGEI
jgi:DNA-binding transcriptional MerR regulator